MDCEIKLSFDDAILREEENWMALEARTKKL